MVFKIGYIKRTLKRLQNRIVFNEELLERTLIYSGREHGGKVLAETLKTALNIDELDYVLGIPRGGVPVVYIVAKELKKKMDVVVVRKILIPWNTEAGYGAVAPDGTTVINEELRQYLGFSDSEVEKHVLRTLFEVKRREKKFRRNRSYKVFKDKEVLVVDDGLASGYTMLAAVKFLRKIGAKKVYVGSPTASTGSLELLHSHADLIIVPNIRSDILGFAVADAYIKWFDLTDEDVMKILEKANMEKLLI